MGELTDDYAHLVVLGNAVCIHSVLEPARDGVARVTWEQVNAAVVELTVTGVLTICVLLVSFEELVHGASKAPLISSEIILVL